MEMIFRFFISLFIYLYDSKNSIFMRFFIDNGSKFGRERLQKRELKLQFREIQGYTFGKDQLFEVNGYSFGKKKNEIT